MDDATPGNGYAALRETAAALQAALINGLHDLPPHLPGSLAPAAAPPPSAAAQPTRRDDQSIIPAAGGLPSVALPAGWSAANGLTPIFDALASDGRNGQRPGPAPRSPDLDPAARFRRDPLGAPMPAQVSTELGRLAEVRALRSTDAGRHHRPPAGTA